MSDLTLLLPIAALMPLTSLLLVTQRSPYQTLVLRGILGAIAALIYALLGAADVALTEALVGTLLSTTLYAIALRSSMVFRLALAEGAVLAPERRALLEDWMQQAFLRLEVVEEGWSRSPPIAGVKIAPHGLLLAGDQLRISSARLHSELLALEGARHWLSSGGGLAPAVPKGSE